MLHGAAGSVLSRTSPLSGLVHARSTAPWSTAAYRALRPSLARPVGKVWELVVHWRSPAYPTPAEIRKPTRPSTGRREADGTRNERAPINFHVVSISYCRDTVRSAQEPAARVTGGAGGRFLRLQTGFFSESRSVGSTTSLSISVRSCLGARPIASRDANSPCSRRWPSKPRSPFDAEQPLCASPQAPGRQPSNRHAFFWSQQCAGDQPERDLFRGYGTLPRVGSRSAPRTSSGFFSTSSSSCAMLARSASSPPRQQGFAYRQRKVARRIFRDASKEPPVDPALSTRRATTLALRPQLCQRPDRGLSPCLAREDGPAPPNSKAGRLSSCRGPLFYVGGFLGPASSELAIIRVTLLRQIFRLESIESSRHSSPFAVVTGLPDCRCSWGLSAGISLARAIATIVERNSIGGETQLEQLSRRPIPGFASSFAQNNRRIAHTVFIFGDTDQDFSCVTRLSRTYIENERGGTIVESICEFWFRWRAWHRFHRSDRKSRVGGVIAAPDPTIQ